MFQSDSFKQGNTLTITLSFYKVMVEQKKMTVRAQLKKKKGGGGLLATTQKGWGISFMT